MYCRSGTDRRFVFAHQAAALCCVKLPHGCHLEIMTSHVNSKI